MKQPSLASPEPGQSTSSPPDAGAGRLQRIEIWWFHFENRFVITGTPGRRDWYANILANPRVVIETRHGDFPATAVPVSDRDFRHRFFTERRHPLVLNPGRACGSGEDRTHDHPRPGLMPDEAGRASQVPMSGYRLRPDWVQPHIEYVTAAFGGVKGWPCESSHGEQR